MDIESGGGFRRCPICVVPVRVDADVLETRFSGKPCLRPEGRRVRGETPSLCTSSSQAMNKNDIEEWVGRAKKEI